MNSLNKAWKLFTWHTLEVLAIGVAVATSVFSISNARKQNRKITAITEIADINFYDKRLLDMAASLLALYESQSEKFANETKYVLTQFKTELEEKLSNCECFKKSLEQDKSQNTHSQNPRLAHNNHKQIQEHKKLKPQPLG